MRVKSDEKRQEIVAVAREVFREKGYAEASMAEISARLGGSKGTLYSYFTSKEELFMAAMLDMANRTAGPILAELEQAADFSAVLPMFVKKLMTALCSAEILDFRRMLIGEAGRTRLGKLLYEQGPGQYVAKLAELLAAQMREGHFREADPLRAAMHLQSLCMGGLVQQRLEGVIEQPSEKEITAYAAAAADVFLRAYTAEPPAPSATEPKPPRRRKSRDL